MKKFKVNARGYARKFAHRANRAIQWIGQE